MCFLILQYIDRKIKRVKLNTFIKLLLYKDNKNKHSIKTNNFLKDKLYKKEFVFGNRYRGGYYNDTHKGLKLEKIE